MFLQNHEKGTLKKRLKHPVGLIGLTLFAALGVACSVACSNTDAVLHPYRGCHRHSCACAHMRAHAPVRVGFLALGTDSQHDFSHNMTLVMTLGPGVPVNHAG